MYICAKKKTSWPPMVYKTFYLIFLFCLNDIGVIFFLAEILFWTHKFELRNRVSLSTENHLHSTTFTVFAPTQGGQLTALVFAHCSDPDQCLQWQNHVPSDTRLMSLVSNPCLQWQTHVPSASKHISPVPDSSSKCHQTHVSSVSSCVSQTSGIW